MAPTIKVRSIVQFDYCFDILCAVLYIVCVYVCTGNANDLRPFVNCSISIESIEVGKKMLCGRLVFSQWKRE